MEQWVFQNLIGGSNVPFSKIGKLQFYMLISKEKTKFSSGFFKAELHDWKKHELMEDFLQGDSAKRPPRVRVFGIFFFFLKNC